MKTLLRFGWTWVWASIFFSPQLDACAAAPAPGLERFYIGTYTSGASQGVYQSSLNLGNGTFGPTNLAGATSDPSFVALSPDRRFLYSVNEMEGTVSAFSVDPVSGRLAFLNQQPSNGSSPCHLVVDSTGRNVIVANYGGGSITMYPVQTNGMLGAASAHYQDPGTSPHAHCVAIDQNDHYVFVCDLGLDQVRSYVLDPQAGTLATNTAFITSVPAGSGPRHITFDPQYKRAYVICETSSQIIGFNYNSADGTLASFQTVSTLPPGYTNGNTCAEIVVHPSGKFVYGSNRGYNSVAVFSVDPDDGTLTPVQQQPVGATPRNFAIDPTGSWCIVANQDSSTVQLYSIDPQTGKLTYAGQSLSVSTPVCILPFLLQPPQPLIVPRSMSTNTLQLSVSNSLSLLTYQLYQSPALETGNTWNLLATGDRGQTDFSLSNNLPQSFYLVQVLTNY
jgi:6-phosphogluconolactonase